MSFVCLFSLGGGGQADGRKRVVEAGYPLNLF